MLRSISISMYCLCVDGSWERHSFVLKGTLGLCDVNLLNLPVGGELSSLATKSLLEGFPFSS